LVGASVGSTTALYTYNHLDQRVTKTLNGHTRLLLYDQAGNLISEMDAATGTVLAEYIWLDDTPLGFVQSGQTYQVHVDHLGTPKALTDGGGQVVWKASYNPFGKASITSQGPTFNLRFPGQYYDTETGLHYNWHRYYDPDTGRYITSDPIGLGGGINTYAYALNNPKSLYDPYGLWAIGDPLPQSIVDVSAGFGDTISLGLTGAVRKALGTDSAVNRCSAAYTTGEVVGIGHGFILGGALGWRASGSKAVGMEYSHWIPARAKKWPLMPQWLSKRLLKKGNKLNGNYVTPARHYRHDPYRYPRGWRNLGSRYHPALQQLDRVPHTYKGAAIGAGLTGMSTIGD